MESLARLIPFVLRQRRTLILSVVLSVGAALFAVAQLSLVYPAMQILLEGKTYDQDVRTKLEQARAAVEKESNRLAEIESTLQDPNWQKANSDEAKSELRRDKRKTLEDLKKGQWDVAKFSWIDAHVLQLPRISAGSATRAHVV